MVSLVLFIRPTLLSPELGAKLRTMIQNMRISGAPINIHTVTESMSGQLLPLEVIYKEKTER